MMAGWNPKSVTLQRDVHTAPRRSHRLRATRIYNEDLVWRWRRALGDGSESACTATYALISTHSAQWLYTVSSKQVSIVLLTRL